jgi:integrase/recombinase XerC
MDIDSAIDSFIQFQQIEQNASEHTLKAYSIDLAELADYMETDSITEVETADFFFLRSFVAMLYEKKLTKSTIGRKMSAVKSFFKYLYKKGILQENPSRLLKYPKKEKLELKIFNIDDVMLLISAPDVTEPAGVRDNLIHELLYSTGMRVGELNACNIGDIDFSGKRILVKGKGKKERIVPLHDTITVKIKHYLSVIPNMLQEGYFPNCDALILNRRGGRLSSRNILALVKQYLKKCGLPETFSPHSFRHSCASHLLAGGADLRAIQNLLGHESLATTQKYTHLDLQKLIANYMDTFPKAN